MTKYKSAREAWAAVDRIFPRDYAQHSLSSQRAGYPIFRSTDPEYCGYICDLGDRLEVNLQDGQSLNFWYETEEDAEPKPYRVDVFPNHTEYYFSDLGEAIRYGREAEKSGKDAFLLEHVLDGKYGVVCRLD